MTSSLQPHVSEAVKRGRPLDPEIDDAIVRAAAHVMLTDGIQRMTVPGVAAAAGVAKTTVYRRYATPAQLALAAINRLNLQARDPETGSVRTDLIAVLEEARQRIDPTVTATVLVEAQTHPEILEAARRADDRPGDRSLPARPPAGHRAQRAPRRSRRRDRRHAVLGAYFTRFYESGRPGPGVARASGGPTAPGIQGLTADVAASARAARRAAVAGGSGGSP